MVRSGIECWVVATVGHVCRSHTISILQCIVKATKAVTWSHPSALFGIIGTKLSGVVVHPFLAEWSSHPPSTSKMPDTQTGCARHHHLTFFYPSWHIRGFPLASCRIDKR